MRFARYLLRESKRLGKEVDGAVGYIGISFRAG